LYDVDITEYREPFFGSGSVGLVYLNSVNSFFHNLKKVWINDKDLSLFFLWKSIIENPSELKENIKNYTPHVNDFYSFREDLLNVNEHSDYIDIGFKKIVIHQISYSGLGIKSGGPLGGRSQNSQYKIDCRWSPDYICNKINEIHLILNKFKVKYTSFDFSLLLDDIHDSLLIYLDPPYYIKGNELYQEQFSAEDHLRLSKMLKEIKCKWVLSYDYCDSVLDMYKWANIKEINVNYTIKGSNTKKEVFISNGQIKL